MREKIDYLGGQGVNRTLDTRIFSRLSLMGYLNLLPPSANDHMENLSYFAVPITTKSNKSKLSLVQKPSKVRKKYVCKPKPRVRLVRKMCIQCGVTKSVNQFHKRRGRRGGYASPCKACRSVKNRAFYLANKRLWPQYHKRGNRKVQGIMTRLSDVLLTREWRVREIPCVE